MSKHKGGTSHSPGSKGESLRVYVPPLTFTDIARDSGNESSYRRGYHGGRSLNPVLTFLSQGTSIGNNEQVLAMSDASKLPLSTSEFKHCPSKKEPPSLPVNAKIAAQTYSKYLSDYEKVEINEFETIYYINSKKVKSNTVKGVDNYGFDNQAQEYLCESGDHIGYRYEIMKSLGRGSFG